MDEVGNRARWPERDRDDRISDELTRAVIGDITAAVDLVEAVQRRRLGTVGIEQHVFRPRSNAECVDVGMLEEEQIVVARPSAEQKAVLERECASW